jgi:hypothetical protein
MNEPGLTFGRVGEPFGESLVVAEPLVRQVRPGEHVRLAKWVRLGPLNPGSGTMLSAMSRSLSSKSTV